MQAAHTKGEKRKLMRRLNVDASRGVGLEFGDPFTFKRNAMEVVAAVRTVYGDDADVSCCVTWKVEASSHRFVAVVSEGQPAPSALPGYHAPMHGKTASREKGPRPIKTIPPII